MTRRIRLSCAVLLFLLTVPRCADLLGAESPSDVVIAVYTAANDGNTAEVNKHLSAPDPAAIEIMGTLASGGKQQPWKPSVTPGSLRSIEILSEEKTTYRATVRFTLTFKNGTTQEHVLQLIKEAGYWKIMR